MRTDDLLLELLRPERISSVTFFSARSQHIEFLAAGGEVAVNFGTIEGVLAQKPVLILAGTYAAPGARMLLKKLHMPLLEVAPAADFDELAQLASLRECWDGRHWARCSSPNWT